MFLMEDFLEDVAGIGATASLLLMELVNHPNSTRGRLRTEREEENRLKAEAARRRDIEMREHKRAWDLREESLKRDGY